LVAGCDIKKITCLFVIIALMICAKCAFGVGEPRRLRIISLAPATTEILFALGLGDEIVGVSSFCDYPPRAREKEKVGTFSHPNVEKILSLKPDIIFGTGLEQASVVTMLRGLGLKVCVSDPASTGELFYSIKEIASLTGKDKEADSLIAEMRREIKAIEVRRKADRAKGKPKVFVEIWNDPLLTAAKESFINELIKIAGARNIAGDVRRAYVHFSAEEVIYRDPDCIILTYMSKRMPLGALKSRPGWQNMTAVRENRIYNDIDSDTLLRPAPRLVEGLRELEKRFYP